MKHSSPAFYYLPVVFVAGFGTSTVIPFIISAIDEDEDVNWHKYTTNRYAALIIF